MKLSDVEIVRLRAICKVRGLDFQRLISLPDEARKLINEIKWSNQNGNTRG